MVLQRGNDLVIKRSIGNIDGRPTERTTTTESFAVPGTNGGITFKLHKHQDVEYAVPKENAIRGDQTVRETQNAHINKALFDANFDKIDWSK